MVGIADWQWMAVHSKCLARQIVTFRSVLKSHIQLTHLLDRQQNWHCSFFQNVNFSFTWRLGIKMNDQPLIYSGSTTICKRKFGLTRHKLKLHVCATRAASINECHNTRSRTKTTSTSTIQDNVGGTFSDINQLET